MPQEAEPTDQPKPTEIPTPTPAFNPVHCDYWTEPRRKPNPGPGIVLPDGEYSPPPPIDVPRTPIPEYSNVGDLKGELIAQKCLEYGIIAGADAEKFLSEREAHFGIMKHAAHRAKLRNQAAATQDPAEREAILESLPPYPETMLSFRVATEHDYSQSVASWIGDTGGKVTSIYINPDPFPQTVFGKTVMREGSLTAEVPLSITLALSQLQGVISAKDTRGELIDKHPSGLHPRNYPG